MGKYTQKIAHIEEKERLITTFVILITITVCYNNTGMVVQQGQIYGKSTSFHYGKYTQKIAGVLELW